MKGISRKNINLHLIERQFNLIDRTILDALVDKNWAKEWSITPIQELRFKKYAISTIKGVLKISTKKATIAYDEFRKTHGLKIK